MGRITQRVDPRSIADDLERCGRAAVAVLVAGRIEAFPARVVRRDDLYVGLDPSALTSEGGFGRATLILDDGSFWFDLRAANLRGSMLPAQSVPSGAPDDLAWFVFRAERETAWDYGSLHEEPEE
ncbi:hypothetical protein [Rhodococcus sp. B50]|uniref:hypothetical protein n=1 Tax=Rhodococcus sp. B50 TaxID=2682847 RepID=UPI001BD3377D|nr:hypothetical protein [Rhodococcus sp. B50]MBS9371279.1 hypothetical protein [Rhodococcus sp. B50]